MPYLRTMFRPLFIIVLLTLSFAAHAQSVVLKYDAFVGPAHAGVIVVEVEAEGGAYEVRGRARSKGLMEFFKETRGWFSVRGRLTPDGPQTDFYEYYDKDRERERYITVAGSDVTYVKNGQRRANEPRLPGSDLVTALWIVDECAALDDVHTGRDGYAFTLKEDGGGFCRFEVQENDEDEPPFELRVDYGQRGGRRVPVDIRSGGGWAGRLTLVE